jgi:prepilin-type N-terminal cleavage/methylation domain-containing protein
LRHVEESYPSIDTPFIRKYFPRAQEGVMNSKAKRGYSLIELIATVAMAGILAAIAVPSWNRLLPSYQLDSSARQVHSELYTMKMRAAAENVGFQLVYSDGAASYSIKRDSAVLVTKPLPTSVVVTNAGAISFSPRGTASANRIRLQSSDGMCKQVVVSATGRVRICKPSDCSDDC